MHPIIHTKNIIEVKNVSFSYARKEILKDINFAIHQGDYLAIVGANGSGKTTLIRIIMGLIKPSAGSVELFGQDIRKFKDWSKIGYVSQKATHTDPRFPATVKEVVLMARVAKRGLFHVLNYNDYKIVSECLNRVGMVGYENSLIGQLSAGQQQRVFIARALALEPKIIFLDEPTTGIDINSQESFYKLLKRLNAELGITLVLVSHDIERVLREAMHIACIDHRLVFHDSPEAFLKDKRSLQFFGKNMYIIEHQHHAARNIPI